MRILVFFLSCLCLFRNVPKKSVAESVVVRVIQTTYDQKQFPKLVPVLTTTTNIWYRDSIAIEQINKIDIHTYNGTTKIVKEVLDHFAYINFSTKSVYYYKSFTDTAACTKTRIDLDNIANEGGWNFFKADSIGNTSAAIDLPDTMLNGKTYRRMQCKAKLAHGDMICTMIFDCSRPKFLFNLDEEYRRLVGCPVVQVFYTPIGKRNPLSTEIKILSDTLSAGEQKVFAAWRKNELMTNIEKKF